MLNELVRFSEFGFEFSNISGDTFYMKIFLSLVLLVVIAGASFFVHIPDNESPEYFSWKEERTRNQVYQKTMESVFLNPSFAFRSLELIEVAPGPVYYSRWGHIILRFVGSGASSEEDLALSFLADFADFPVNKWKASFGGYVVLPKLDMMKNYQQEYQAEKRFMNGYLLKTTAEQNDRLKSVLKEWVLDNTKPETYSFFGNNCVGLMMKLLSKAGIMSPDAAEKGYFPKDVPDLLLSNDLISQEDFTKYAAK